MVVVAWAGYVATDKGKPEAGVEGEEVDDPPTRSKHECVYMVRWTDHHNRMPTSGRKPGLQANGL